jgi:hypothetical protein
MITYFLVLASLANLDTMAPKVISPHTTYEECAKAARTMNTDERLQTENSRDLALRFVCLKLVADV